MTPQERLIVETMRNALQVAKSVVKGLAGQAGIGEENGIVRTLETALAAARELPINDAQGETEGISLPDLQRRDQRIIQAALTELAARLHAEPEPDLTIDVERLIADLTREEGFDTSDLESLLDKVDALVENPHQDRL